LATKVTVDWPHPKIFAFPGSAIPILRTLVLFLLYRLSHAREPPREFRRCRRRLFVYLWTILSMSLRSLIWHPLRRLASSIGIKSTGRRGPLAVLLIPIDDARRKMARRARPDPGWGYRHAGAFPHSPTTVRDLVRIIHGLGAEEPTGRRSAQSTRPSPRSRPRARSSALATRLHGAMRVGWWRAGHSRSRSHWRLNVRRSSVARRPSRAAAE